MARYDLSDAEWRVIEPLLPQNPRTRRRPRFADRVETDRGASP